MVDADDGLIDDLEDKDKLIPSTAGRAGDWKVNKDDKDTALSFPKDDLPVNKGGADKSKTAATMKGKTGTVEGAWGASLGITLNNFQPYDASKYDGISFYAKVGPKSTTAVRLQFADGQTVPDGGICKACWNHFGKDLTLTKDWKKYTVSFAELAQMEGWGDPRPPSVDAKRLMQILWAVSGKGTDFDVWVDQVKFLKCK
jgi:hypothetical protein